MEVNGGLSGNPKIETSQLPVTICAVEAKSDWLFDFLPSALETSDSRGDHATSRT